MDFCDLPLLCGCSLWLIRVVRKPIQSPWGLPCRNTADPFQQLQKPCRNKQKQSSKEHRSRQPTGMRWTLDVRWGEAAFFKLVLIYFGEFYKFGELFLCLLTITRLLFPASSFPCIVIRSHDWLDGFNIVTFCQLKALADPKVLSRNCSLTDCFHKEPKPASGRYGVTWSPQRQSHCAIISARLQFSAGPTRSVLRPTPIKKRGF